MTAIQPNALATGQIKVAEPHHLIGFIVNNPERMPCLLHRHREVPWLEPADDIEQLGVGRYESGHAFLRSNPGQLKVALSPLDLLAIQPSTPLLIARASSSVSTAIEGIQPFRFRTWLLALQGAVELSAEKRSGILEKLPSFLHRAHNGGCDGELVFLRFMAALSRDRLLDAPGTHEGLIDHFRQAALGADLPVNIIASNGRDLLVFSPSQPLLYCQFEGIESCEPCRIGGAFSWIGPAHQSHRHFKGVCVADRRLPFVESSWREIPEGQVLVVDASLKVRCCE
jgi:hypothetical protein